MNRDREAAIADEQDAMREQIDALRDLETATLDWAAVAERVADTIFALKQGALAPPAAMEQFRRAQAEYEAALARFRAAPSAEGAEDVQQFAGAVLDAATQVFTKPSPAYKVLFDSVVAGLEEVQASAESRSAKNVDYLAEITALEARSVALDEERNGLQEDLNGKMDALAAREDASINAIASAIAPTMEALAHEMERVGVLAAKEVQMQDSLGLLSKIANNTAAIADNTGGGGAPAGGAGGGAPEAPGRGTPEYAMVQTAQTLAAIEGGLQRSEDVSPLIELLRQQLAEANLTEGVNLVAAVQAQIASGQHPNLDPMIAYARAVGATENAAILERIKALLPSAQMGDWQTRAGLYQVHANEMIIPEPFAGALRHLVGEGIVARTGPAFAHAGQTPSTTTTTNGPVTVNVAIHGDNPQAIWQDLRPLLDEYIRPAGRGGIIMRGQTARRRRG